MKWHSMRGSGAILAWACGIVVALAWIVSATTNRPWLRSNVFDLLPASEYDVLTETATRAVEGEIATQLLFLIGHVDQSLALTSADRFGAILREHRLIDSVATRIEGSQYSSIANFYYAYRRQILSDVQLASIDVESGEAIERNALATMYSPLGAGRATGLVTDPFFLFPGSLQALQPSSASLELRNDHLWVEQDGRQYVFVRARLNEPTLSIADQESLAEHLATATEELLSSDPEVDVLSTGFSFFAHAATQSAKNEVSVIGLGSLIGLVLLVFFTFRSLRPLFLIALSILAGCVFALAVTLWVFDFVHLFTLVFGASLIGVSVDYSFHYVAEDAFGGENWTPAVGLSRIFAGITLGLLTSILAYLALTVAPFPGLRQLAVFSSAGLVGAYLTLICCCRVWRRRLVVHDRSVIFRAASRYLDAWRNFQVTHRFLLIGILMIVVFSSLGLIEIDDDIAVLQAQPNDLKRQEAAIQEALGVESGGSFLLVSSPSDEELLQLEESIRGTLDGMILAEDLGSYQAISRWVPSRARQERSYAAYRELLDARLYRYFQGLGIPTDTIDETMAELAQSPTPLEVSDWLAHPVSEESRALWLDTADTVSASVILLFDLEDVVGLKNILEDYPSISYVHKTADLSRLFGLYRLRITLVLVAAYLMILVGLTKRYGLRRASAVLIPPVFAGALALSVVTIAGESLNLFHFLALILVLGIGIDFTLFLAEGHGDLRSTMFAITLSALTTMLSFGLLSLSGTYAVHSFGVTVLIGIACAYLLSPLVVAYETRWRAG